MRTKGSFLRESRSPSAPPDEQKAADALWHATESGIALPSPLRFSSANGDLAFGYRVQALNVRRWQESGRQVVGHKIGMTSIAVQKQFSIDHPTRGVLFSSMLHASGARLTFPVACSQGRAEGEMAFVLRDGVRGTPDLCDLLDVIDYALPAIEIVNSRIAKWNVGASDFVADNAAAEFVVLGTDKIDCRKTDLKAVIMKMELNGESPSIGTGADCLGSPLNALHWLALELAGTEYPLKKGDVIMSGSLGKALPVSAGDQVHMRLDKRAPVTVQFQ